jgi:hypothetical protein
MSANYEINSHGASNNKTQPTSLETFGATEERK